MSLQKSNSALTEVTPKRHTSSSLSIHPYFGKVDPALAGSLIDSLSNEGDVVLDPFCGSGTVLHEALLHHRSAIGWDSSALAAMICASKLHGITSAEKDKMLSIHNQITRERDKVISMTLADFSSFIPKMKRVLKVSKWFSENSLKELAFLRNYIDVNRKNLSDSCNLLMTIAFSRIITQASNQQGESSYRSIDKDDSPGRVIDLYIKALSSTIKAAERFNLEMQECGFERTSFEQVKEGYKLSFNNRAAEIKRFDSRCYESLEIEKQADLVVSSPPYLMSWDYGLYHKFRFYWLGFDLDSYEGTEIGRHLRRKKDDVERYTSDMELIFKSLNKALSDKGKIALINAPSVVYGNLVDTNEILGACGEKAGWKLTECLPTIDIPGPHHGMYGSLESRKASAPGEAGKKEHVLIFERG